PNKTVRVRVDLQPQTGTVEWNDAADAFTITNVLQRNYRLQVIPMQADGAPGGLDFYVQSIRIGNEDVFGREFSAAAGMAPIEIAVADDMGSITGTVTDTSGNPAEATVLLR